MAVSDRAGLGTTAESVTFRKFDLCFQQLTAGMCFAPTMYNRHEDGATMVQDTHVITADELFRMPDDGFYKYELVAGRLRTMTPAGGLHGVVSLRLAIAIGVHVE